MDIQNLFPIPLGITKLDREITKEEIEFAKSCSAVPNGNTNETSENTFVLESLPILKTELLSKVNEYCKKVYRINEEVELYITQSWFTYTTPGNDHHIHTHPNSFVSGVLYLTAQGDNDKIEFHRMKHSSILTNPTEYNEYNSESWWMPASCRTIYLFPSDTWHGVPTTKSDDLRISLAFNTFVKGNLGNPINLTHLSL